MKTIAVLATLDTKGEEVTFLADEIRRQGAEPFLVDVGVMDDPAVTADVSAADVVRAGGGALDALRSAGSRQDAAPVLAAGAIAVLRERIEAGSVHAVVGLGGTQGTSLCGTVMQALPYGFPKIILSTVASGDTTAFVGIKDVTMMFAVGDILGLNPVLRTMLANAAGAVVGMAAATRPIDPAAGVRGTVALTNLGVLTNGAMRAIDRIHAAGYEVITFHAIGAGGRAMEQMMREGLVTGVFDYALGEVTDWMHGALRAADAQRLRTAGELGLPQVICPGGAEHVGLLLSEPNVVPEAWAMHAHVFHSPVILAPRLSPDQLADVGHEITGRLASTRGDAVFMIPLRGVSRYSIPGGPLHDPEGDEAFFGALRTTMPATVELREMDCGAEDDAFVDAAVDALVAMMEARA